MKTLSLWLSLIALSITTYSQQVAKSITGTNGQFIGFLEFRPSDYGSQKHPLIIFLHGIGERGNGTTQVQNVAANGIPMLCSKGATMRFTANGQTSSFVVLSPQLNSYYGSWPSWYVEEMIKYAKANLQIDPNRIYVTGLSLGGGGVWTYAFTSYDNAAQAAAIAPVCATDDGNDANACASAGAASLPIWAFHCKDDGTVAYTNTQHVQMVLGMGCGSMKPTPRYTYYLSGGHSGAWNNAYDTGHITRAVDSSLVTSGASTNINFTARPNLYEWFLTQSRSATPQLVAVAGADQSVTLPIATVTLDGSASYVSSGTISSYQWTFISGPATPVIATPILPVTAVVSLVAGVYKFQLTVTSSTGATSTSIVTVTVNGLSNQTPSSIAGSNQTITLPTNSVSLDGSASKDADGSITAYTWSQVSGPSTASLSNTGAAATTASNLVQGTYTFQLKVADNAGATATSTVTVTVNAAPVASAGGTGLKGDYYNTVDLSGSIIYSQTDATVNFSWPNSPGTGIGSDYFSVRWTGQVQAQYSETYTFYTQSDDGIRVWVNGQQVINNWTDHGTIENSGTISLTAGVKYDIKVEYYEKTGGAVASLWWSSPSTSKAIVPQGQLFPAAGTSTGSGSGSGTGLKGDYYNTVDLSGSIIYSQTDATVNFNWPSSPGTGIGSDNFSVRWTGQVLPQYTETYTFYTQSDDGIRVWVNGQQLINNWTDHGTIENSGTISLTAGVKYDIKVEYYEKAGGAVASLWWSSPSTTKAIIPASQLFPASGSTVTPTTGTGLKGDYYNTVDLSGSIIYSQTDATINFNWSGSPGTGIGSNYFSVRWTGQVLPLYSETYTFYTQSDDGISVWVNGQQLINNWTDHGPIENSGTITLTAGVKYDIRVEYYEKTGGAVASLWWSSPSTAKAIIPASQLFPASGATVTPTTGTGLKGEYYNTNNLSGAVIYSQTDATVNFNWPNSPGSGIGSDYFSVRWTGQVLPLYSETYTFYTQSDDGIRVWVNGQKIIDNWTVHGTIENSGAITLSAGVKYDIAIEYYEQTGGAVASLWWSSPSTAKAVVPQSQLFPPASASTARVATASTAVAAATTQTAAARSEQLITVKTGIAPNPVTGGQPVRVNINSTQAAPATIQVIGATGNVVYVQRINLAAGLTISSLPTSGLSKGFYIVNVISGGKTQSFPMIVQ